MSRRLAFILLLSIAAASGLFAQDFSIRSLREWGDSNKKPPAFCNGA